MVTATGVTFPGGGLQPGLLTGQFGRAAGTSNRGERNGRAARQGQRGERREVQLAGVDIQIEGAAIGAGGRASQHGRRQLRLDVACVAGGDSVRQPGAEQAATRGGGDQVAKRPELERVQADDTTCRTGSGGSGDIHQGLCLRASRIRQREDHVRRIGVAGAGAGNDVALNRSGGRIDDGITRGLGSARRGAAGLGGGRRRRHAEQQRDGAAPRSSDAVPVGAGVVAARAGDGQRLDATRGGRA